MKQNKLFLIAMVCLLSVTGYAQTTDTFRQPYPLGKKTIPEPEFYGGSMACSSERTEKVECTDVQCNL